MNPRHTIADYFTLVQRLHELEATKVTAWKTLGYLPDALYGTFSGVSRADRHTIVSFYHRGVALIGTCIAAAALAAATVVTVMLGVGVSAPIAAVAVAAMAYAIVAHFLFLGPLSSLTQIKRVMYGFPTKASCARRGQTRRLGVGVCVSGGPGRRGGTLASRVDRPDRRCGSSYTRPARSGEPNQLGSKPSVVGMMLILSTGLGLLVLLGIGGKWRVEHDAKIERDAKNAMKKNGDAR